jgi:hypothetical protein
MYVRLCVAMSRRLGLDPVPCPGDVLRHVSLARIWRLHAGLLPGDVEWVAAGPHTMAYLRDALDDDSPAASPERRSSSRDSYMSGNASSRGSSRDSSRDSLPPSRKRKYKTVRVAAASPPEQPIRVPGTPCARTSGYRCPRLAEVVPESP